MERGTWWATVQSIAESNMTEVTQHKQWTDITSRTNKGTLCVKWINVGPKENKNKLLVVD